MLTSAPTKSTSPLIRGGDLRRRPASAQAVKMLPVEDPGTGKSIGAVPDATPADCMAALDAAERAFPSWAATPARQRSRVLRRGAELLLDDVDRIARTLSLESGKPLAEAREEVSFAAEYLEWSAEEAVRTSGRIDEHPEGGCEFVVRRRPVGPCLIVSPWNFPLAIPARGVGPALAAGCTVVLRPGEGAPLSAFALAETLSAAGLPDGCLSVVASSDPAATDPLLADSRLAKLTFTGSPRVGAHLLRLAAAQALRATAELGGNAPALVFADADLEAAVEAVAAAKCRNAGQACTAANRIYVDRSIAEGFSTRLAQRMAALRPGHGTDPEADIGPMISAASVERLRGLVEDALARGARVVLPGGPLEGPGHFFAPVVLADVPADARVMREEIFGPIAAIAAFDTEAQAIEMANSSDMGLAGYVMSGDRGRAVRVAGALEAGMVGINTGRVSCAAAPFGGVKGSGYGRSGGREGIDEYLETSYMAIAEG
jgi:succinate-semialdehyde dehydrogenase / glutarate-semialdehyde dehydrogenase